MTQRLNPNQNPMFVEDGGGGSGGGVGAVLVWQQPTTMSEILAQVPAVSSGQGAVVQMIDDGSGFDWDVDAVSLDNVLFVGMNGIATLRVKAGADLSVGSSLHLRNVDLLGNNGTIVTRSDFFLDMETGDITGDASPNYSAPIEVLGGTIFTARLRSVTLSGQTGGEQGFQPAINLQNNATVNAYTSDQSALASHAFGTVGGGAGTVNYVIDGTCPVPDAAAFGSGVTAAEVWAGQGSIITWNASIGNAGWPDLYARIQAAVAANGFVFVAMISDTTNLFRIDTPTVELTHVYFHALTPATIVVPDGVTLVADADGKAYLQGYNVYFSYNGTNAPFYDGSDHLQLNFVKGGFQSQNGTAFHVTSPGVVDIDLDGGFFIQDGNGLVDVANGVVVNARFTNGCNLGNLGTSSIANFSGAGNANVHVTYDNSVQFYDPEPVAGGPNLTVTVSPLTQYSIQRTANAAINQFALVKVSTTASRYVMMAAGDPAQLMVGVAQSAASGAAATFNNLEVPGVPSTMLSDGTTVIAAGDLVQPSQTVAGRVMKGSANAIGTALTAAVAVANTQFQAIGRSTAPSDLGLAFSIVDAASHTAGDNQNASGGTLGQMFSVTRPCTILGGRFFWSGPNKTIRIALWNSGGTVVAAVDVVTTGTGIYTALFASPVPISGTDLFNTKFFITHCDQSNTRYERLVPGNIALPGSTGSGQSTATNNAGNPAMNGQTIQARGYNYFNASINTKPGTGGTGVNVEFYPVDPIYTVP